jgi:hypothetical protein
MLGEENDEFVKAAIYNCELEKEESKSECGDEDGYRDIDNLLI